MNATEAELAATEYMLGLEQMVGGVVGRKARQIHGRAEVRDIRPLLLKQRVILDRIIRLADSGADPLRPDFVEADRKVAELDVRIADAWGRCLEQLKILWLTEGGAPMEDSP